MSRWWPESLAVTLAPGFVSAGARRVEVEAGEAKPAWRPAVDALAGLLPGAMRANVAVLLSDRFARYFALPSSAALAAEADWRLFAERRFEALFGGTAGACSILLSKKTASGRIACAVERALIDALQDALRGGGHRLVSLQPHFAGAFNRARRRIGAADAWFVSQEPGSLTIGLAAGGGWQSIRQRRVGARWMDELPAVLDRESQLAGVTSRVPTAYLAALEALAPLPARLGGFDVRALAP